MKVLVTGGAGFIGSNIVDALLARGDQVVVIDDLSTGHTENVNAGAKFLHLDMRSEKLMDLFEAEKFDLICHQAARGNVRASMEDPMDFADVNVRGGVNLLECARKTGVKKIVYSSTGGCVYGELVYAPADEKHPIQPRDPYGASKAAFELYLRVYELNYGLEYTILRYPNVYGPRQDPFGEAGVVTIFTGQMLRNQPTTTNGDGENLRDYVFVGDVVRANLLALQPGMGTNDAFNLGWGKGVSVNQVFAALKNLTGYQQPQNFGPAKLGEVRWSFLNAEKAKTVLGWAPEVPLEEGLRKTVEYFRQVLS